MAGQIIDPKLHGKLTTTKIWLNANIFEREQETDGILLATLSNTSVLFLGDVGTAKTKHIRLATSMFGLSMFDILISDTTKPDQLFGPVDVPALANEGIQRVKTHGYAPWAESIFLDEVFKAGPTVLNPLLTLINEHIFRNGDEGIIRCPTKVVFGASNEVPTDTKLRAFYDRFLLRYEVGYLKTKKNLRRMLDNGLVDRKRELEGSRELVDPIIGHADALEMMAAVAEVKVPAEVQEVVISVKDKVAQLTSIPISDRRLNWALRLMQARAVMDNRDTVNIGDTEVLSNCLWDKPEHRLKVQTLVLAHSSGSEADVLSYEEMADSVWETAVKSGDLAGAKKKLTKMRRNTRHHSSTAAKIIHRSIESKLGRIEEMLKQRESFIVLQISQNGIKMVKLSPTVATAWTPSQLRSVGFHWYRAGSYWYIQLKANQKMRNYRVKFSALVAEKLGVKVEYRKL